MHKDGTYLVKHINHVDGIPEREITIKNEIVLIEGIEFQQESFFSDNIVVRQIK
jgi:hypothetical protein